MRRARRQRRRPRRRPDADRHDDGRCTDMTVRRRRRSLPGAGAVAVDARTAGIAAVHRLRHRRHHRWRRCSASVRSITEPVIQLDDVRGSEEGVTPVEAQVLARNTSEDTTYCIEVTITATDRDGLSLATAVAEPTTGDGTLGPGRSANFNAAVRRPDAAGDRRGARQLLRLRDPPRGLLTASSAHASLTLPACSEEYTLRSGKPPNTGEGTQ